MIKIFVEDDLILSEIYSNRHREYIAGLKQGLDIAGIGYILTEEQFADDPNYDD